MSFIAGRDSHFGSYRPSYAALPSSVCYEQTKISINKKLGCIRLSLESPRVFWEGNQGLFCCSMNANNAGIQVHATRQGEKESTRHEVETRESTNEQKSQTLTMPAKRRSQ